MSVEYFKSTCVCNIFKQNAHNTPVIRVNRWLENNVVES